MRPAVRCAAVAFVLIAMGCGAAPEATRASVSPRVESTGPPAPGCMYRGEVRRVALSAPEAGFPALWLKEARATASLTQAAPSEGVRLDARAQVAGFGLAGRLSSEALSLREPAFLGPLVLLPAGASPALESVDAGRVRVALPTGLRSGEYFPRVRFRRRPEASLGCDAFVLRQGSASSEELAASAQAALGFSDDAPRLRVTPGSPLGLAAADGGDVLAVMDTSTGDGALSSQVYARLLARGAASSRVVFGDWRGPQLVAWVPNARLEEQSPGGAGGLFGGVGAIGNGEDAPVRTFPVCTASAAQVLVAVGRGSVTEEIGALQPGQRFVRGREASGFLEIAPHPDDPLGVMPGASLWIRSGPLACDDLPPVYGVDLRRLATRPPLDFHAQVSVTAVSGLEGVQPGASCELLAHYRPIDRFLPCRAELRCQTAAGTLPLFGTRESNGFLQCEVGGGDPPWLSAEDDETHDPSNDPAITLDTRTGSLEIHDDASGDHGEFRLSGHLEGLTAEPVGVAPRR